MNDVDNLVEAQAQLDVTRIPTFFGVKEKDAFTAEQWIVKVEDARARGDWDDARTIQQANNVIRMKALSWKENTTGMGIMPVTWANYKKSFLQTFSTTKNVNLTMGMIQDLKQKVNETVLDFSHRINQFAQDLKALNPNATLPNPVYPANVTGMEGWNAHNADHLQAAADRLVQHGYDLSTDRFKTNILIAGLKPSLSDEVHRRRPPGGYQAMHEVYAVALEFEKLQASKQGSSKAVSMLSEEEEKEMETDKQAFMRAVAALEEMWNNNNEEEYEQVISALNHTYKKKSQKFKRGPFTPYGKKPYRGTNSGNSANSGNRFQGECFFCKKKGHMKKDCKEFRKQPKVNANQEIAVQSQNQNHNFVAEFNPYAYVREEPQMQAQLSAMHLNY